jgi:hypothetical protein
MAQKDKCSDKSGLPIGNLRASSSAISEIYLFLCLAPWVFLLDTSLSAKEVILDRAPLSRISQPSPKEDSQLVVSGMAYQ